MPPSSIVTPLRQVLIGAGLMICILCQFAIAALDSLDAEPQITAAQIEAGREAAEADTTLDAARKQMTLELYAQALQWFQQATEARARLAQLESQVRDAAQRIEAIRTGRVQPGREMNGIDAVLAAGDLERIELALTEEQLALQQAREAQRKLESGLSRQLVGSKALSEEISAKIKSLEQIDADLQAPLTNEPLLAQAHISMLKARRMLRQAELELLRLRFGNHDLLTNLAQAERDLTSAEITKRQSRVDALSQAAQRLRETRAQEGRRQAEALMSGAEALPKPLQLIAEENARYHLELEGLVQREQAIAVDLQAAQAGLEEIKNDFQLTRQRVEVVGASEAIGNMLRRRRQELPSLQRYRRTSAERGIEISRATGRQLEIDERLRERGKTVAVVARVLDALPVDNRTIFVQETATLVGARRDTLDELQKVYGRYIGQITALDLAERQLVEVASSYIDYIDEQLIWTPGPGLQQLLDPMEFRQSLFWLLAPDNWTDVIHDAWTLLQQRPAWVGLMLGLFLLLLNNRKKAVQHLGEIARQTNKIRTDRFQLTLQAIVYTLVITGALPVLLIGSGWLLATLPTVSPFTFSMANGLMKVGLLLVSTRFIIQICKQDGLADRHFRWPQSIREPLIHEFSWILPVAMPLAFLVAATAGDESPQAAQALGRQAYILVMVVSALFLFRLLRRRSRLMQAVASTNGHASLLQLHVLWFPLLMVTPLAFAVTSALGYHYTSLHLEQRAEQTFWFFVGLFLLRELLLRSLYIAERHLRFENAVRRREGLRAQRAQAGGEGIDEETPLASLDIPELDFEALSDQTKRMVRAGFLFFTVIGIWSIWSDLLPVLTFLNTMELPFHITRIADGIAKEVPATLGDLTTGIILIIITILAAKNIPGVLEITLLQRLPLDAGARYAITTLSQYAIAGIGALTAFSTLGLQWTSIQWLVAALSVGLGFGLQEIVANFISGIILLFERPIRVGDVVTIDNTTGVVSRIRIRATTITNYDKQELLIPNKAFITGQVINWTLSDSTNRILIHVGVAYGANVSRAMDLMLEAAQENENVLEEPNPVVSFEAFGDNALMLTLRGYLGSMDNRLATITALHRAINDKFNAANINIAFPQRDIHLYVGRPLDIRLHRGAPGDPPTAQ